MLTYWNNFYIQKKHGFLRNTKRQFFIRSFLITPLMDTIRFMTITLICMVVFHYALLLHTAAYVVIIVFLVTLICIVDIFISGKLVSCRKGGKMTPLEEKDPELLKMINEEWERLS